MYQAIVTRFLSPDYVRGARVKATAEAGSVIVNWDHAVDRDGNHIAAAKALAERFGWEGHFVGGSLPTGDGNVFVLVHPGYTFTVVGRKRSTGRPRQPKKA